MVRSLDIEIKLFQGIFNGFKFLDELNVSHLINRDTCAWKHELFVELFMMEDVEMVSTTDGSQCIIFFCQHPICPAVEVDLEGQSVN